MSFKGNRFIQFVIISLLIHLSIALFSLIPIRPQLAANENITIELVSPPTMTEKADSQKKNQKVETLEKQVVEQDLKPSLDEAPDTRFLSAQNQKVDKQTVTKNRGEFQNNKKRAPPGKSNESNKKISLNSIAPKLGSKSAFDPSALKQDNPQTQDSSETAAAGGSATQDYLKDVDQGLETLLNAREFKYYSYYNRIRRQLSQHWEPKVRVKMSQMFKQGRFLAAATDRVTKLIVVLDTKGNLVKVQMLKDSGVTDLDDAAIEAFQSAAPFPNPPQGIIEQDGTVKIRWDFVLET